MGGTDEIVVIFNFAHSLYFCATDTHAVSRQACCGGCVAVHGMYGGRRQASSLSKAQKQNSNKTSPV